MGLFGKLKQALTPPEYSTETVEFPTYESPDAAVQAWFEPVSENFGCIATELDRIADETDDRETADELASVSRKARMAAETYCPDDPGGDE